MREIKFRAWDKAYNEMCTAWDSGLNVSGWLKSPEVFVVMQYTGLKDKNGREIYEGDILRSSVPTYLGEEPDGPIRVVFRHAYFGVTRDDFEFAPLMIHAQVSEVIGNIYENPDLLEQA